jgi:alkyldihydroxyacetonephosphate synthase
MVLAERLARVLPGLLTSESPVDRLAYARDLWPRMHLDVRAGRLPHGSKPALIAWPTSTAEAAALVRFCHDEGVPLVPFGAGSGVCGGILPDARTVVLDLKRLAAIRSLDEAAPLLDVEAGALGIRLEEEIQRRGYTIGHFPSSIICSTVGGWLAARGAGQCSGRYGKIEDMVASIEMIDGRGEVHRLHRRDGGLDLTPLLIGSEGTLGVITSAQLRLHRVAASRAFSSYTFPGIEAGWEAMRAMFQAGLRPAVARLYDPFDSLMAKMGGVKRPGVKRGPGDGHRAIGAVLRAPRLLNELLDGIGGRALGGSTLVLIFEGEGNDPSTDSQRAADLCARHGGRPLGEGPARRWLEHRYSISYRQSPVFRSGAFSDTMEVAAPWSRLADLHEGVRRALGRHVFVMAHLSHSYPDGCSIYFSFAGSASTDDEAARVYDDAWRAAMGAAIAAGGTLSHHHGVGRSKAPRLGEELGHGVAIIRRLMGAFDPAGILNPGNLLPRSDQTPPEPPAPGPARAFSLDEVSRTATFPASMTLDEAEAQLASRGHTLPCAVRGQTLGSWLEAGAPGAPDRWSDPVDHLVAGLRATMIDGAELRVAPGPRRAVGPDLTALLLGARRRYGSLIDVDLRVCTRHEPPARPLAYHGPRTPPIEAGEESLAGRIEQSLRGS